MGILDSVGFTVSDFEKIKPVKEVKIKKEKTELNKDQVEMIAEAYVNGEAMERGWPYWALKSNMDIDYVVSAVKELMLMESESEVSE